MKHDLAYVSDIKECLVHNSSNPEIEKIVIFSESGLGIEIDSRSKKIQLLKMDLNHFDAIKYACRQAKDCVVYSTPFVKFDSNLKSIKFEAMDGVVFRSPDTYYVFGRKARLEKMSNIDDILGGSFKMPDFKFAKIGYFRHSNISPSSFGWKISKGFFLSDYKEAVSAEAVSAEPEKEIYIPAKIDMEVDRDTKIDVVIVSVDYNDFLEITLEKNRMLFDRITVVTSSSDKRCLDICERNGARVVITDCMYSDGAKFNKGKAINEGLGSLSDPDVVLLMDADIIVQSLEGLDNIEGNCIYYRDRIMLRDYESYDRFKDGSCDFEVESIGPVGYFQLFKYSGRIKYPESSTDAAWSDVRFARKFKKKIRIDTPVLHLGEDRKNWSGRVTEDFNSNRSIRIKSINDWGVCQIKTLRNSKYGKLNLDIQTAFMHHRSGWKEAISGMYRINGDGSGPTIDCFLEKNFCWSSNHRKIYDSPWYGILHNPIDCPKWYLKMVNNSRITEVPEFLESLRECKGLYVLSQREKCMLEDRISSMGFDIPIEAIKHPFGESERKWSFSEYRKNPKMIHIGWWMRNIDSFYLLDVDIKRIRLRLDRNVESLISSIFEMRCSEVEEIDFVSDLEYDRIICESIVFVDMIDCVASNTILECIDRHVPIVCNRHPSIVEYLGEEYPLYYDRISEVGSLITKERILEASLYLSKVGRPLELYRQIERSRIYRDIKGYDIRTLFSPGEFGESMGGIYNPGYIRFEGRNIFIPRVEEFTETERGKDDLWKKTSAVPMIVETDDEFRIISARELKMEIGSKNRIEDFRIFSHKGKLYSNHIFVDSDRIYPVISEIDPISGKMHLLGEINLDMETNSVEKNWTFISIDDRLMMIYSLNPLIIFDVDLKSMSGKKVIKSNSKIRWNVDGYISASTNPIMTEEGILMGFHSRSKDLVYHQGFLLFDKNFKIKKMSKYPYISGGDLDTINKGVFYTMSLMEKEDSILCFAGDGDYKSMILDIKKDDLWKG